MRKLVIPFLGAGFLLLCYYLFIRPYEYAINFTAKTTAGDIIASGRLWNRSLPGASILLVDSCSAFRQSVSMNGHHYLLHWKFDHINDSTTKVRVELTEPARRLMNRIMIPFSDQPIEKDGEDMIRNFYKVLNEHLRITKVNVLGIHNFEERFCVCRSLSTAQSSKARGMMGDYPILTAFVADFDLKASGPPLIKINRWGHSRDSLKFEFCFPIEKRDSLPAFDSFHYRELPSFRAVKAEYYGNYITSDRAWYALLNFATRSNHKISGLPVEVFHNNPNLGMNEEEWKAEVYIPVD